MPKPTLTEMVQELQKTVAGLEQQVKGIADLDKGSRRLSDELNQLKVTIAQETAQLKVALGQEVAQLKAEIATIREKATANEKAIDQATQRRWTLVVAIFSAFLGGLLTLFIQFSLRALPK
jgi:uncharacterized protein YoxC